MQALHASFITPELQVADLEMPWAYCAVSYIGAACVELALVEKEETDASRFILDPIKQQHGMAQESTGCRKQVEF